MHPKVHVSQRLSQDGRTVDVKGPIGDWEDDALAAVFTVVLSQIGADGNVVTAIGGSTRVHTNRGRPSTWSVRVRVLDGGALRPGEATVAAYATFAGTDGGSEWYAWTLPTRLEPAGG